MKAMILAAGRGERMKPLTNSCPKPLLKIAGKSLIEYHLEKLAAIGIDDVVINHAWLGDKIVEHLNHRENFGLNIHFSEEANGALETAGGIAKALPMLNDDNKPFLVINGDVFTGFDFTQLPELTQEQQGHLFLVNNPEHNIDGDFCLENGLISNKTNQENKPLFTTYTFSGIALYRPSFFAQVAGDKKSGLAPLLKQAADLKLLSGSVLNHTWTDVGTPERLQQLDKQITQKVSKEK